MNVCLLATALTTIGAPPVASCSYYVIIFSSQKVDRVFSPHCAHTFATFVAADDRQIAEYFTISWCSRRDVRLFAPPELGRNRTLPESFERAAKKGGQVSMWGPFTIKPCLYRSAQRQFARLEAAEVTGAIKWKALDGKTRFDHCNRAINCMHAVSDISGVLAKSGHRCGDSGSLFVVNHFKRCGLLLENDSSLDWIWLAVRPDDCSVNRRIACP